MDDRLDRVGQPEQSPSNPLDIGAAFQEIYRSPSPKGPILSAQAVYSRGTSFPPPSDPSIEAPLEDKLFSQPEPEGEALTFGKDPEQTDPPAHEPIWAVLPKEDPAGGESSRKSSSRLAFRLLILFALISLGWFTAPAALPILEDFAIKAAAYSAAFSFPSGGEDFLLWKFADILAPSQEGEEENTASSDNSSAESGLSSGSSQSEEDSSTASQSSSSSSSSAPPRERPEDAGDIYEVCMPNTYSTNPKYLQFQSGFIRNDTGVSTVDVSSLLEQKPDLPIAADGSIEVLLICTHSTESYEMEDLGWYDKSYNSRTTDKTKNMIAVAERIAQELEAAGIGVVQDKELYDYPSYNGAYQRSAASIQKYLEQYPTIKVVLDVHRDAIENDQGLRTKPTVEVDGKKAAQVMIISGCDDGSGNLPNWKENLRFAARIQSQCAQLHPNLMRPLFFCYRNYNQALTKGSLLVEVGGHANTLEEACYSGTLFGKALANTLKELAGKA